MNVEEIGKLIPNDWLQKYWDEFFEMSEKITKTLIISKAVEQKWTKPMKSLADYDCFLAAEAEKQRMSIDEVRHFLVEAGRLKARNYIFEKHCVPLLPKDEEGWCVASRETLLKFVNQSIKDANIRF